jgi:hypothetical protein
MSAFPPFLLALALASLTPGGDDPPRASGPAVPSDPAFTALLTDGSTVAGQLRRLGESEGVTLADEAGQEHSMPFGRLVKLTREGGEAVLFPDGDRIARCKIGKSTDFAIGVHSFAMEDLAVPIDAILGLVLNAPTEPDAADALMVRVRGEPRTTETAWLANGDKLTGLFAGIDDRNLLFQTPGGKLDLRRTDSGVIALGFAQGQVIYRRPAGRFLELTLLDGSRLGVTKTRVERGQVIATTRFDAEVRLPLGELAQVHALNGSVAYLSDRETTDTLSEPYVGPTRPYRRNTNVAGEVLHVAGRAYDRGLGTQSKTYLIYKLSPGDKRFQAQVALDDRAGPLGSVVFRVRVDRSIRYESPTMTAGEPPRSIDVDLNGAKALVLMTEFGERGDVQDLADWIEARIIR